MTLSESFAKSRAQKEYCEDNNKPYDAPSDGICYYCDRQIYEIITMEEASSEPITGCPYCHYSFCE